MTRRTRLFAVALLISSGLTSTVWPHAAMAQSMFAAPAAQANQEELTRAELDTLKSAQDMVDATDEMLESLNPIASNAGVGELISRLEAHRNELANLANGLDPQGNKLSTAAIKRILRDKGAIAGGDLAKQASTWRKATYDRLKDLSRLRHLPTLMNVVDPGSKVLGAWAGGDVAGALLQLTSGVCKAAVVGIAVGAVAGTGAVTIPVGIAAAGAAFGSEYLYVKYVEPLFGDMNDTIVYLKTMDRMINEKVLNSYSDIKNASGVSVTDKLRQYMEGKISDTELKNFIAPLRPTMDQRNAQLQAKQSEDKKKVVAALRSIASDNPDLMALTDSYEKGTLDHRGEAQLLQALQEEYGEGCRQQVSTNYVRSWLAKLDAKKLQSVTAKENPEAMTGIYGCLCQQYGSVGTSVFYHPDTYGPYNERYMCQHPGDPCVVDGVGGCGRVPFPTDEDAWNYCLGENLLYPTLDENGNATPGTGIRLDEYLAGKLTVKKIVSAQ